MRFSAFLLLLLIRVDPIWSQEDLLACVDPDVRVGILRSITMGTAVTRTVPDSVTELGDLGDFEFIASIVGPVSARTAFKTALSQSDTMQRMTAMLQAAGWHDEHRGNDQGGGFVVEHEIQTRLLCRDGERAQMIRQSAGGVQYVTIDFFPLNPILLTCDELVSTPPETRTTPGSDIWRYLPRLTLPDDANLIPLLIETPSGGQRSASTGTGSASDVCRKTDDAGWTAVGTPARASAGAKSVRSR